MKSLLRLLVILVASFAIGFIYNQIYSEGIQWQFLFPASSSNDVSVKIIAADSALILLQSGAAGFIDLRAIDDYNLDHIRGAVHYSLQEILRKEFRANLRRKKKWILYDARGDLENMRIAANSLGGKGAESVYILYGGFLAWLNKGYFTETGVTY